MFAYFRNINREQRQTSIVKAHFCRPKFKDLNEPHHEKTYFLHMRKTKAQISCAVSEQLISTFVVKT